jgi:tetratricopeptide (TPR) repeat protein
VYYDKDAFSAGDGALLEFSRRAAEATVLLLFVPKGGVPSDSFVRKELLAFLTTTVCHATRYDLDPESLSTEESACAARRIARVLMVDRHGAVEWPREGGAPTGLPSICVTRCLRAFFADERPRLRGNSSSPVHVATAALAMAWGVPPETVRSRIEERRRVWIFRACAAFVSGLVMLGAWFAYSRSERHQVSEILDAIISKPGVVQAAGAGPAGDWAEALWRAGRVDEARSVLEFVSSDRATTVATALVEVMAETGDYADAIQLATKYKRDAEEYGAIGKIAHAALASDTVDRLARAASSSDAVARAMVWVQLANGQLAVNHPADALPSLEAALLAAHSVDPGNAYARSMMLSQVALALLEEKDFAKARDAATEAREAAEALTSAERRAGVLTNVASVLIKLGDVDRAIALADAFQKEGDPLTVKRLRNHVLNEACDYLAQQGHLSRAVAAAAQVEDIFCTRRSETDPFAARKLTHPASASRVRPRGGCFGWIRFMWFGTRCWSRASQFARWRGRWASRATPCGSTCSKRGPSGSRRSRVRVRFARRSRRGSRRCWRSLLGGRGASSA